MEDPSNPAPRNEPAGALERVREALAKQAERLRILHEIDRAILTEKAPVAIAEAVLGRLRDLLARPTAIPVL